MSVDGLSGGGECKDQSEDLTPFTATAPVGVKVAVRATGTRAGARARKGQRGVRCAF